MAAPNKLAHQVAGGRWLLTGGGGYEPLRDVPRTWTHLLAPRPPDIRLTHGHTSRPPGASTHPAAPAARPLS